MQYSFLNIYPFFAILLLQTVAQPSVNNEPTSTRLPTPMNNNNVTNNNNSQNNSSDISIVNTNIVNGTVQKGRNENNSTEEEENIVSCKKGNRIGSFIIQEPNRSSLIFPNSKEYLIRWTYTNWVKKPPQFIDIKLQQITANSIPSWKNIIAENISIGNGATSFLWKPRNIADGGYKIRLVADGKETFIPPGTNPTLVNQPCFEDGEAMPGVSGEFRISNLKELRAYPDMYGPRGINSSNSSYRVSVIILILSCLQIWFSLP